ncbi:MAG: hypothetical protein F6K17_04805 [Okeania sp. SIO3C4]|nr:hypothetical protein [Okeania sp. SIO3C4]
MWNGHLARSRSRSPFLIFSGRQDASPHLYHVRLNTYTLEKGRQKGILV